MSLKEARERIKKAVKSGATTLDLTDLELSTLPPQIARLANLQTLCLSFNQLSTLPPEIARLTNLQHLDLRNNQLSTLPPEIAQLTNLRGLYLSDNQLSTLPPEIVQLANLQILDLMNNQLSTLPPEIAQLANLPHLYLSYNQLSTLPPEIAQLTNLQELYLSYNQLSTLPAEIAQLTNLQELYVSHNQLSTLPAEIAQLTNLQQLYLRNNPLNPVLQSAYDRGLDVLREYLSSLVEAEPLYEAKLVLVGEGDVGKTTLLNALTGREPREGEPTTHGVEIDIEALRLPHPEKDGIEIQLNAWDFGGQEVYRVTHQFFFSRRSVYLLVWEPRMGVKQCQVEDWLKLIRLRVGSGARVIIVSTHCKTGERIARIDKPVLERDFGSMIVGFHEVDSMVNDPKTKQKVGVAALKTLIAETAKNLEQMGMEFNRDWKAARDELLNMDAPRIAYCDFSAICERHGISAAATQALAYLMHDLGYIVYYGDDERLKNDVVLQPEWLTKAIAVVLEDRKTQEMDGILPDRRLTEVWRDHSLKDQPHYETDLYPFFLRLMEKYDVSYRLVDEEATLVAQHVPQVRPTELPWLPEIEPPDGTRRIAMVCDMEEDPPGLVPWMIVRTHPYAYEQRNEKDEVHRYHWQKGMFLQYQQDATAMLELRGREFHIYVQALFPKYFMARLEQILQKLIEDNWPGLKDRYRFAVPCQGHRDGKPCDGSFRIDFLQHRHEAKGKNEVDCQNCFSSQNIDALLYGFEKEDVREALSALKEEIAGLRVGQKELAARLGHYFYALMRAIATEAKDGPRLFTVEPVDGKWHQLTRKSYRLHLWCEAEGCPHPVGEEGKGVYPFKTDREWVKKVAPYANLIAGILKTVLPMAVPAANLAFGKEFMNQLDIENHLNIMKEATGKLLEGDFAMAGPSRLREGLLSEPERSGILALHALLRDLDPTHEKLGLKRIPTYTGDYLWLCDKHYKDSQSKIPDTIG